MTRPGAAGAAFAAGDKVITMRADDTKLSFDEIDGAATRELATLTLAQARPHQSSAFARGRDGRVAAGCRLAPRSSARPANAASRCRSAMSTL